MRTVDVVELAVFNYGPPAIWRVSRAMRWRLGGSESTRAIERGQFGCTQAKCWRIIWKSHPDKLMPFEDLSKESS